MKEKYLIQVQRSRNHVQRYKIRHYLGYYCFEQYRGAWSRLNTKNFYYGRFVA